MTEKTRSDNCDKRRWKRFINANETPPACSGTYTYPLVERKTNDNIKKQDPGKLRREKFLYRMWLDREWQVAVDFGCGIGANFDCFDQQQNKSKLLVGLDPDPARAHSAMTHANRLKYVEAVVICADVSLFENSPDDLFVDAVLCSQVLGHVPRKELGRIVRGISAKLRTGGSCAISIPVVGASFTDDPTAGGWVSGDDLVHLVYCDRSPFDKDYRKKVPGEIFDQYAACSPQDVLPVRNFWLPEFPNVSQHELPTPVATIPPTIGQAIAPFFNVSEVVLYAIHRHVARKTKEIGIGDAFIIMTRT